MLPAHVWLLHLALPDIGDPDIAAELPVPFWLLHPALPGSGDPDSAVARVGVCPVDPDPSLGSQTDSPVLSGYCVPPAEILGRHCCT